MKEMSGEEITEELLSDPARSARIKRGLAEFAVREQPALPDLSALASRYAEGAQRAKCPSRKFWNRKSHL